MTIKAFGYLRTSSATNVGPDKDSETRQRAAIQDYADRNGIEIVGWFYDAAVKGAELIQDRPGFAEMLTAITGNGVRTILVETAGRFARDLMVQETGYTYLKGMGITLVPVDDPDAFTSDTPTQVLIRQILGAVAQFEKAMLVAKLAGARKRARATKPDYHEGRAPAPEAARTMARELRQTGMALRPISAALADAGYLNPNGRPYSASSIVSMIRA